MKIKYLFLFTVILFCKFNNALGQYSLGVKAGINLNNTNIKSDDLDRPDFTDQTTSFHLGVFSKIKLTKNLLLIPELQFIQKGYSITSFSNGNNGLTENLTKFQINYIEIPTMLSYSVFKQLNIEFGQVIGVKISAYGKRDDLKENLTKEFDSILEFGLTIGIRINLTDKIGLSSRYVWSLTSLDKSDPNISPIITKEYNRNLLISLTYDIRRLHD